MPLGSLNYDFLSSTEHEPSFGSLIPQVIKSATAQNLNIYTLATIGDSFLKLIMSISPYCQYPGDSKLTPKRDRQVSNIYLYRLAKEKNLESYFPANETNCGEKENIWLPSNDKINKDTSGKRIKKTSPDKPLADRVEALIGAFLILKDYPTTIRFMYWLGLDAIPVSANGKD